MTGIGAVVDSPVASEEPEVLVVRFGGVDGFLFGGGRLEGVVGDGMIDMLSPDVRG